MGVWPPRQGRAGGGGAFAVRHFAHWPVDAWKSNYSVIPPDPICSRPHLRCAQRRYSLTRLWARVVWVTRSQTTDSECARLGSLRSGFAQVPLVVPFRRRLGAKSALPLGHRSQTRAGGIGTTLKVE